MRGMDYDSEASVSERRYTRDSKQDILNLRVNSRPTNTQIILPERLSNFNTVL